MVLSRLLIGIGEVFSIATEFRRNSSVPSVIASIAEHCRYLPRIHSIGFYEDSGISLSDLLNFEI